MTSGLSGLEEPVVLRRAAGVERLGVVTRWCLLGLAPRFTSEPDTVGTARLVLAESDLALTV